jgi:hypothetical protein
MKYVALAIIVVWLFADLILILNERNLTEFFLLEELSLSDNVKIRVVCDGEVKSIQLLNKNSEPENVTSVTKKWGFFLQIKCENNYYTYNCITKKLRKKHIKSEGNYEPKDGQLAAQKSAMDKSQRFFVCIFAVVR